MARSVSEPALRFAGVEVPARSGDWAQEQVLPGAHRQYGASAGLAVEDAEVSWAGVMVQLELHDRDRDRFCVLLPDYCQPPTSRAGFPSDMLVMVVGAVVPLAAVA